MVSKLLGKLKKIDTNYTNLHELDCSSKVQTLSNIAAAIETVGYKLIDLIPTL